MTLVSIITPSLNQVQFLRQTIRSVLDQDYSELEYVVVDGGSSDGSIDVIRAHSGRLAWWVSEADDGQADAINKGIAHARGEIVGWLNSDDYYLPGAVSAAVRTFSANPDAVFVYGDMQAVDGSDLPINIFRYPQVSLQDLLCFTIIGQPAVFVRRRAWDAVGGLDPRFDLLLDHQLWIKLAAEGPARHVDQVWAAARYHAAAKNIAQARLFGPEAFRILEWAQAEPGVGPVLQPIRRQAQASAYRVDARYLLDAGLPAESLRSWFKSFSIHPVPALKRLNILASGILEAIGLGAIRRATIRRRKAHFQG
jgi:glycosyltransferase involved in cell wall biosynthesis